MGRFRRAILMAALLTVIVAWPAVAAPLVGTRAMAMGGASTAVVNDATAAYWNPAGMSLHKFALTSSASAETSSLGAFGNLNWYLMSSYDYEAAMAELMAAMSDSLNDHPFYSGATSFQGITSQWVGLSAYVSADATIIGDNVVFDSGGTLTQGTLTAEAHVYAEGNLTASAKFPMSPGLEWMAVGISAKALYFLDYTAANDAVGNSYYYEALGYGYAGDAGLMLQISETVRVGATVKDILWTATGSDSLYDWDGTSSGGERTWTRPAKLNLGVGIFPMDGMTIAADLQGINLGDIGDTTFMTANLGFEQVLKPFALRAGGMMEFPKTPGGPCQFTVTGGFGLGLGILRCDASVLYGFAYHSVGVRTLFALQW